MITSCCTNIHSYDDQHVPRTWGSGVDITALYTSGRVQAFALLDIFSDNSDSLIIDGQPLVTIPSEKVSGFAKTSVVMTPL